MTAGAEVRHLPGMAKGRSGWRQTHSGLRRHSSEGWNPGKGCRIGDGMAGFIRMPTFGYRARVLPFPLCGNGLFKPLDSGLRRNDNGGVRLSAGGYGPPRGLAPSACGGGEFHFRPSRLSVPCSSLWILDRCRPIRSAAIKAWTATKAGSCSISQEQNGVNTAAHSAASEE